MDNETIMAIESLKAQVNSWIECCRKWQAEAVKSEENIEQIFVEMMDFVKDRCVVVEALASDSNNENYYAGRFDAYCNVGGFVNELKKKYVKGGAEG